MQRSKAPPKELAAKHGLNRKTGRKWGKRSFLHDAPMGPKAPRSTVLTPEGEVVAVALPVAGSPFPFLPRGYVRFMVLIAAEKLADGFKARQR